MDNIIELNTDKMEPPAVGNDLFENRTAVAEMRGADQAEVSILLLAYNRLDKTRRCVESILDNTAQRMEHCNISRRFHMTARELYISQKIWGLPMPFWGLV